MLLEQSKLRGVQSIFELLYYSVPLIDNFFVYCFALFVINIFIVSSILLFFLLTLFYSDILILSSKRIIKRFPEKKNKKQSNKLGRV